jgi:MFS family permease
MEDPAVSHDTRPEGRPATYGEVFGNPEYRAIYLASALSWVGDFMAKAAVTALVYKQTQSVTASAATFAISFLPWVVGGPVLAALAERYPHRAVMISCDLARAVLIALVALPHLPIPAMLLLLFAAALLNPPFDASRAALLPRVLEGDRYVLGIALQSSTGQAAQVVGYLSGAALAAVNPRLALLLDAATFVLSAGLITLWVHGRSAVLSRAQRAHLLKETAQGFRVVFGTPVLRAIAITVLATQLFASPPEGLAAAWANTREHVVAHRGLAQGLIMMGGPFGFFLGGLIINRFLTPERRRQLIRPFSVLVPLTLVPVLLDPPVLVVALLAALCGAATAGMLPASNGLFVQALPRQYRARAFGVMQSGLQITQAGAVMLTGWLANHRSLPHVVGWWSVAGVVLVLAVSVRWPAESEFAAAIERTQRANAAAEAAESASTMPVPPQPAGPQAGNGRHRGGAHRRTVRPTEPVPPGTMEW